MSHETMRLDREVADLNRRLNRMQEALDVLVAWKVEQSKPITIDFSNAFADDSPRHRQDKARELLKADK